MATPENDSVKHPSEYTTEPFLGFHVMVVDSGTKVTDERSGEEVVITDESFARKGSVIFCTQNMFDRMKNRVAKPT